MFKPEVILSVFVIIGAIVGIISLHSSFLLARKHRGIVTWVYPIVVVIAIIIATKGVESIQGYPVNHRPDVKFEYIGHVVYDGSAVVTVRVDTGIRVYRWMPTEEEQEKLEEAEDAKKKGQTHMLRMIEGDEPEVELVRLDQLDPKENY